MLPAVDQLQVIGTVVDQIHAQRAVQKDEPLGAHARLEVDTVFRIAQSYGLTEEVFSPERMLGRLQASVALLPKGITRS